MAPLCADSDEMILLQCLRTLCVFSARLFARGGDNSRERIFQDLNGYCVAQTRFLWLLR